MVRFLKRAFSDMKASARAQHEVDKAQFCAVRAESRANFEENRGRNTFAKAKAAAKEAYDAARVRPVERETRMQEKREAQIAAATARIVAANARIAAANARCAAAQASGQGGVAERNG